MIEDLSKYHHFIGNLFPAPSRAEDWLQYRLNDDQIEFYREHGYLAGVRLLNEEQIEALKNEVIELVDPKHPGNSLLYQFNSNESADPQMILFHALGAWRIAPGSSRHPLASRFHCCRLTITGWRRAFLA